MVQQYFHWLLGLVLPSSQEILCFPCNSRQQCSFFIKCQRNRLLWPDYGYAILAVNVYGVSELSYLMITTTTDLLGTWIGVGSGVMVYYSVNKPASLTISNSRFVHNNVLLRFKSTACLSELLSPLANGSPIPVPYAAGLSVVYNRVNQNISVTLSNSDTSYNKGYPVAGVLVLYFNSLPNVTTVITESLISANQDTMCICRGTGLAMVTYFSKEFAKYYKRSLVSDWICLSVLQTNISYHLAALNDGTESNEISGVVYLSTSQINGTMVHVEFRNVTFAYNNAPDIGTGLYAETILTSNNGIKSLAVHLIDVLVNGNIHNQDSTSFMYMPGAVMTFVEIASAHISSTDEGESVFTHNVGSAVEAYNSDVYMSGNVLFEYNFGLNGAALVLLGQSHLFLSINLLAHFENNVFKFGGAIYSFNDGVGDDTCTFQVLSNNLSAIIEHSPLVYFDNNIASVGRSSVSAISMNKCKQLQMDEPINLQDLYSSIFHFKNKHSFLNLSSTPARLVPCINGEPQLDYFNSLLPTLKTHPGKKFNISLAALDSNDDAIYTRVQVKFHNSYQQKQEPSSWWLSSCEEEQFLESSKYAPCANISLRIHARNLNESVNYIPFGYSISTALFSFPEGPPTYQALVRLNKCPPGFQLNHVTGTCECSSLIKALNRDYDFSFTCDTQNSIINAPDLVPWIGCINNRDGQHCEMGVSPSCFPGFCNYSVKQWTSGSAEICIETRESALCGKCIGNYSTVFGSNKCHQCSNWWLFTIAFYAVSGLLLVLLLFVAELTISTGTLNGVIFFANIWNAGLFEILKYQTHSFWFDLSQIYISFLNLGLGFPLCFYDGMNEMVKSWLQLVFPVYLLVLVALVVIVSRYSMRVSSLVYSRAVPVLVTVVHLSFSRLFLAVVEAFSLGQIYEGDNEVDYVHVWLRDGSVLYFKNIQHIMLMIVSFVLAAVLILPYLILLLGARWWIKYRFINLYCKPILDAVHGPYKEDRYYWFGLRLILVLQQLIVFLASGQYSINLVFWINCPILIIFTVIHTSAWPFKSKSVCILDGLLMVVLCLAVYTCSVLQLYSDDFLLIELFILSTLATVVFLLFIMIVSYHILLVILMCCSTHLKSSSAEKAFRYLASFINYHDASNKLAELYQPINNERQPTPQFREPLLDVSYGST